MSHTLCGLGIMLSFSILSFTTPTARTPDPQLNTPAATIDVETVGPKVGEVLADFNLPDQRGLRHSLKSILGPNGAVIVFFRSADW